MVQQLNETQSAWVFFNKLIIIIRDEMKEMHIYDFITYNNDFNSPIHPL